MRLPPCTSCIMGLVVGVLVIACGNGGQRAGASAGPQSPVDGSVGRGDSGTTMSGVDAAPTAGRDAAAPVAVDAGPIVAPQLLSPDIVVDQFGYLPAAEKIAVIRSPQVGFDKASAFTPGATYALVDAHSGHKLLEAAPTSWKSGATDSSSGDKAWWFDFSTVTTPGDYFVLDETANVRSAVFSLSSDVYRDVLVQATRMFYYQRDGAAKEAKYAGAAWADGVAHPQDATCGLYSGGSAAKDLHGGWFDAGDQNRYTNWGASDVIELLRAFVENPAAFTDDTNIPESGNGVPDLLDEAKWELDWMARMQGNDGSVLSIAGHAGASPPSSDTSPCRYGPASTSATLTSAAAFAFASRVFASVNGAATAYPGYAAGLSTRAENAWTWAAANPNVKFFNAQNKVGAGEQEVSDATSLLQKKLQAAVFLFALTGTGTYKTFFDANASQLLSSFDPFHMEPIDTALEYTKAPGATPSVVSTITSTFKSNVEGSSYFGVHSTSSDPYLAYLKDYTWGSNQTKAGQGNMFADVVAFGIDAAGAAQATHVRRAVRALRPRGEPSRARLPVEHVGPRRRGVGDALLSYLVRPRDLVGRARRLEVRAAARLPHGRAEPVVRVGLLLPVELLGQLVRRESALPADGPARPEVVPRLQRQLAARLVGGDRAGRRIPGAVRPAAIEVRPLGGRRA